MNTTNRYILALTLMLTAMSALGAKVQFAGSSMPVITESAEASTGLNDIFVIYDTQGVTMQYAPADGTARCYRFDSYGGAFAEEVSFPLDGAVQTLQLGTADCGYIIEEGTDRYYLWVVNYANHMLSLDALQIADEQECDRARLRLEGNASRITYYTITGQPRELSRELRVDYSTLVYDEQLQAYASIEATATLPSVEATLAVPSPLCDTQFTLSGDKYLSAWGMPQRVESPTFQAIAVEAHATATQAERDNANEQKVQSDMLGGSAPVEVEFSAAVTDAAIFYEWQFATDPDFENVVDRYQQLTLDYTFCESISTYVRFVADNSAGSCQYESDAFQVYVGESALLCPNAFSPGDSEGVNDEWKVSYKSIVQFECHIFNRWGQQMAAFTDPGQGWDGRYQGKLVPAGTYYYVINALGSDGRKYKLSGDINIVKSRTVDNKE